MKHLLLLLFLLCACSKQDVKIEGVEMGMAYKILFKGNAPKKDIQPLIDDLFSEINAKLNRWNELSELSLWNNSTSTDPIKVSPLLLNLVKIADEAHTLTDGKYDPSLGKAIHMWKMSLRLGSKLSLEEVEAFRPSSGWNKVVIHDNALQKFHPDLELDLDGIIKGYFCDLLADKLKTLGYKNFLIEWAGEIKVVGGPFNILSGHEVLSLKNTAIATSGNAFQLYPIKINGKTILYSHFIDPQTLLPIAYQNPKMSKSILHDSCAMADALATSYLLSIDRKE